MGQSSRTGTVGRRQVEVPMRSNPFFPGGTSGGTRGRERAFPRTTSKTLNLTFRSSNHLVMENLPLVVLSSIRERGGGVFCIPSDGILTHTTSYRRPFCNHEILLYRLYSPLVCFGVCAFACRSDRTVDGECLFSFLSCWSLVPRVVSTSHDGTSTLVPPQPYAIFQMHYSLACPMTMCILCITWDC
jgi:hypothetical protein